MHTSNIPKPLPMLSPASQSYLTAVQQRHRPLSLAGLRGFEAAARHLSLTDAAAELNLTQSAVSRQVQGLEDELGTALFFRKAREIILTPAGKIFLPLVLRLLTELDTGVDRLRRDVNSPRVAVTTFASFASLWLIPRLAGFRAVRPSADLDIGATDKLFDLEVEDIDVAIRYLRHENAGDATLLIEELLFPIVSPEYLRTSPKLTCLDDLAKHPLIETTAGGYAEIHATWPGIFEALGKSKMNGRAKLKFDFIAQSFLAAQSGQGVALGRTFGADLFMSGDLVRPIDVAVRTGAGCYLVVAERARGRGEVKAFVDWLSKEVATFNHDLDLWLKRSGVQSKATKLPVKKSTKQTKR